ncbi:kinase-like protein [Schizopora paradoxa]|uniref:non-specific serine/threonine protein kinase n=1 Tax=Schizopora paradoxa TaxID=27342 RepID=A0A0H2S6I8_9AGAM|nr:kinase-like protein [Schizopora paradoxa]
MATTATSHLDLYEPLDIIGNGSFGIIRKVRRKSDGEILARKELNFERMSERDRKQIVAEVNILKDLSHENIVRYIDRFVDRDAGILYILMEYCDGGDLSSVIKQCGRQNRPLPEDTVWSYFFQLLLALQHCHCPNQSGKPGESDAPKRQQILHRDLKPENVFLSGSNTVKLGDFGLSKALGQTSFANTYVGTPYYMSPELIQEKSYDTKSDIWSLGCLIYELCASKPPFHEAQTHSELSMLIRNGRIPPLPKGYSHALNQVIKAMLNLNPAMRPSAQQLLQHERIDFARKVSETEKVLTSVKAHKTNLQAKEKELQSLATTLAEKEGMLSTVLQQKDSEIHRLTQLTQQIDVRVRDAVAKREEELRVAVMRREEEVRTAMAAREEEILEAVRKRESEINEAWRAREEELRGELQGAVTWVEERRKELEEEAERLEKARVDLEKEADALASQKAVRKEKTPFEEVKNLLAPLSRLANSEAEEYQGNTHKRQPSNKLDNTAARRKPSVLETPITTSYKMRMVTPGSTMPMQGVVLTDSGITLQTPMPGLRYTTTPGTELTATGSNAELELTKIIKDSPRVGLNFKTIFNFEEEPESDDGGEGDEEDCEALSSGGSSSGSGSGRSASAVSKNGHVHESPLVVAKRSTKIRSATMKTSAPSRPSQTRASIVTGASEVSGAPPTRLRRPSIRTASGRPQLPPSVSESAINTAAPSTRVGQTRPSASAPTKAKTLPVPATPRYDLADEENLPSPFLRRVEKERVTTAPSTGTISARRRSNQNMLRVMAAANVANSNAATLASAAKAT